MPEATCVRCLDCDDRIYGSSYELDEYLQPGGPTCPSCDSTTLVGVVEEPCPADEPLECDDETHDFGTGMHERDLD